MHSVVALLLVVGMFSVVCELFALRTQQNFLAAFDDLDREVSSDDMLHLGFLQDACQAENDTVLPWNFAAPGDDVDLPSPNAHFSTSLFHQSDPRLLEALSLCPDVDIYLPSSSRGPAGCAAVAGPLKFLQSRLLPDWVLDAKMYDVTTQERTSYLQLCPHTPMLFLSPEHVLNVTKLSSWPATKPVYLMAPGLEGEMTPRDSFTQSVLGLTDLVLCRTKRCDKDLKQLLNRTVTEDAAKKTRVMYTSQVTVDPVNFAQRILGDEAVSEKNATHFANARFAHTTWDFASKSTQDVIDCWSSRAEELPPLDVYLLNQYREGKPTDGERLHRSFPADNNNTQPLSGLTFARAFSNAAFFVCPTANDDCLDLARASGGVIVTGDGYPMNELITGYSEGVLFSTQQSTADDELLLSPPEATYRSADLCAAVLKAHSSTTVNGRMTLATQARLHFNEDAKFFMLSMVELKAFARREQYLQDPQQEERQPNLRRQ
ncbi:hypothetical protein PRNP1_012194 [Phytophthora ramorum]